MQINSFRTFNTVKTCYLHMIWAPTWISTVMCELNNKSTCLERGCSEGSTTEYKARPSLLTLDFRVHGQDSRVGLHLLLSPLLRSPSLQIPHPKVSREAVKHCLFVTSLHFSPRSTCPDWYLSELRQTQKWRSQKSQEQREGRRAWCQLCSVKVQIRKPIRAGCQSRTKRLKFFISQKDWVTFCILTTLFVFSHAWKVGPGEKSCPFPNFKSTHK